MKHKKINSKRLFVGDLIRTNENFKPEENKKQDNLNGFIVYVKGDSYGIRFGAGLGFTNCLNGILRHPVGFELKRDEFDVSSTI